jgi:hypothetical protein
MRLNPFYPDWYLWYLADAYDALGRYEDVVAAIQRMHDPSEGRRLQAIGYAHLGMMDDAKRRRGKSCCAGPDSRSASSVSGRHFGEAGSSSATRRDYVIYKAGLPE